MMKPFLTLSVLFFLVTSDLVASGTWVNANTPYNTSYSNNEYRRHECGASLATFGGFRIGIVVGGRGGTRRPIRLDVDNNTMDLGTTAPHELHHFQSATWRDSIIISGMGFTGGFPSENPSPNVMAYYAKSDTWQTITTVPTARRRGSAAAVVDGDWVYYFCGLTNGHQSGWVTWTDRYNLVTDTWETLTDAPRARDHSVAILHNNKVYLVGGRRSAKNNGGLHAFMVNEIDVFDLGTLTWSTLSTNLPTTRAGLMAVIHQNDAGNPQLSVWGGEALNVTYDIGEGLDLNTLQWATLNPLPAPLHGNQLMKIHNDTLIIAAGSPSGGTEITPNQAGFVKAYAGMTTGLPVEWESFSGKQIGPGVRLSWRVNEQNNREFLVERRSTTQEWQILGQVESLGDGQHSYNFLDDAIPISERYVYRIRQVDWDGQYRYSHLIELQVWLPLLSHPNPARPGSTIRLNIAAEELVLSDATGRALLRKRDSFELRVPEEISPGIYYIHVYEFGTPIRQAKILIR